MFVHLPIYLLDLLMCLSHLLEPIPTQVRAPPMLAHTGLKSKQMLV